MAGQASAALPPNLLERAIQSVAPGWALRRHKARIAMAATGGYGGAGYSERLSNWLPGAGSADSDTIRDLPELRGRSRDLVRNSPIAGGAVEIQATHVVGSGLMLQSQIDAELLRLSPEAAAAWQRRAERRFLLWANDTRCDAFDELNFFELQDVGYRSAYESGDAFVVLAQRARADWPFRMALQLIEADRASNPNRRPDSEGLMAGIERDADGAKVAVHLCSHHPGTVLPQAATWTRVPFRGANSGRRNVLHLVRKLRPAQTRGVPELATIIGTLKQMARLSDAEIDAAVNAAASAVFVKMDPDSFADLYDDEAQRLVIEKAGQWDGGLRPGRAVNLLPGEDVSSPAPGRPNPNFDPFMSAFLGYVGMGLNIPKEVLTKHFQASYSAARAALLDAWRTFMVRRSWLARRFCQPVYEEWLADEVAAGRIAAPGFFTDEVVRAAWCGTTWSGSGPGALDPLKEAKAMRERTDVGVTTLADEVVAYDGGDWEQKHAQRRRETRARLADGLQALPAAAPAAPGGRSAALPDPDDDVEQS
jgi:lambda family phage portal protein